jgi:seryl-tRNA synthetase
MATSPQEDAPDIESIPCPLDEADKRVVEYIDRLHDRIQFLTKELDEAERELLKLREEEANSLNSRGSEPMVSTDIENISKYVRYLAHEHEMDKEEIKRYISLLTGVLKEEIESGEDLHNSSLALWAILKKHEEVASG